MDYHALNDSDVYKTQIQEEQFSVTKIFEKKNSHINSESISVPFSNLDFNNSNFSVE